MTAFAATPEELEAVVRAALWFANLKRIRSTAQVEQHFMRLGLGPRFKVLRPGEVAAYEHDQAELGGWLERIATLKERTKVAAEIRPRLRETVEAGVDLRGGKLRLEFAVTGVQAACALAVAIALDERYGLANRVLRCGNPACGKFNCEFHPAGRPKRHCGPECKAAADVATRKARRAQQQKRRRK